MFGVRKIFLQKDFPNTKHQNDKRISSGGVGLGDENGKALTSSL
jgi:hypothetical protein